MKPAVLLAQYEMSDAALALGTFNGGQPASLFDASCAYRPAGERPQEGFVMRR
ncbi:hypothetical protein FF098_002800 [Parvularcula flava]|uniref:Uncharacterized protein n=1 Tax=Aquisalinus luteolus TaxID=1566827 RepID=A0A8J3A0K6_9PROT|nr:hypothetical protein [Aquisalinus luteolus]NHK26836.1 hypothetical protein [Aquisalinus luteolus]GGH93559.1 hypothetical protein GCM10011355_05680 [Aquisalinus luteolus]